MITLEEAIRTRRSIRLFKPDPIPRETLEEVFDLARWSPSWGNTQPWEFAVFLDEPLERFKTLSVERVMRGEPFQSDIPMPSIWPEELKKRYSDTGKRVFSALSIAREDKEGRHNFYLEMARLFGAPCLVVGLLPSEVALEYAMLDMGIITQSLCLAATARGIGSCIMAASVGYPDLIREIGGIEMDRRIVIGIALGYPEDNPINRFPRMREPLDKLVRWVKNR